MLFYVCRDKLAISTLLQWTKSPNKRAPRRKMEKVTCHLFFVDFLKDLYDTVCRVGKWRGHFRWKYVFDEILSVPTTTNDYQRRSQQRLNTIWIQQYNLTDKLNNWGRQRYMHNYAIDQIILWYWVNLHSEPKNFNYIVRDCGSQNTSHEVSSYSVCSAPCKIPALSYCVLSKIWICYITWMTFTNVT